MFGLGPIFGVVMANPAACFLQAGKKYRIDPLLLHAIAHVESGHDAGAIHVNRNGSKDYGIMQVNERNLSREQKTRVMSDACYGVSKGAEVLAGMISRFGYNWMAVGGYNAGVSKVRGQARMRYAKKVWIYYRSLLFARHRRLEVNE